MFKPETPVIFTAFANPKQDLTNLTREQNGIQDVLLSLERNGKIKKHLQRNDTDLDSYFNFLREWQNEITIFHYGGHADSLGLNLQNTDAFFGPLAHELCSRNKKKLLLVFLNGCSTQQHVQTLFDLGVKAVIATSVSVNDDLATRFAIRFYENLAKDDNLETAYISAANYAKGSRKEPYLQHFGKVVRGLLKSGQKSDKFPWALYVQDDSVLQHQFFSPASTNPLVGYSNVANKHSGIEHQGATYSNEINSEHDLTKIPHQEGLTKEINPMNGLFLLAFLGDGAKVKIEESAIAPFVSSLSTIQSTSLKNASTSALIDMITDYQGILYFMHFSGYSSKENNFGIGNRLSRLLHVQTHSLQWVVINGCDHFSEVEALISNDIKAVITINGGILSQLAVQLCCFFYEAFFQKNFSLKEAFEIAGKCLPVPNFQISIKDPGEINQDTFNFSNWTLFINSKYQEVLDWKLIDFVPRNSSKLTNQEFDKILNLIDEDFFGTFDFMDLLNWGVERNIYDKLKIEFIDPPIGWSRHNFRERLKILASLQVEFRPKDSLELSKAQLDRLLDLIDEDFVGTFLFMDRINWGKEEEIYNKLKLEFIDPPTGWSRSHFRNRLKIFVLKYVKEKTD